MSTFDLQQTLEKLSVTPKTVDSLTLGCPDEWLLHRENEDSWNVLEIVTHLVHGEKEDWVPRAKIILGDGPKEFEPFEREAGFEGLTPEHLPVLLEEFRALRKQGVEEVRTMNLTPEDLKKTGIHPEFGEVNLQQLFATWLVHDLGHIRQLTRVLAVQYDQEVGPWKKYLSILH